MAGIFERELFVVVVFRVKCRKIGTLSEAPFAIPSAVFTMRVGYVGRETGTRHFSPKIARGGGDRISADQCSDGVCPVRSQANENSGRQPKLEKQL